MKKVIVVGLFLIFITTNAFAAVNNTGPDAERNAHREEVKALKKAMHDKQAAAPKADAANKGEGFWEKEGKRSGLGGGQNRFGNLVKNLNPAPFFKDQQARYDARKKAATK